MPCAAALGLMHTTVMWGYNPHPAVRYSPCLPQFAARRTSSDRLYVAGQGPTDTGDIAIDNEPEHKSPWAKLFAQGAMTTIVYDR